MLFLCLPSSPVLAQPATKKIVIGRLLSFPEDQSIGKIVIIDKNFSTTDRHLSGVPLSKCQGKVVAPAGAALFLVANDLVAERKGVLAKLPPDAFVAATFERTSIGDDQAAEIAHLTGLRFLCLNSTEISDKGLTALCSLPNLEFLDISHTNVTGQSLEAIGGLKQLRFLDISANEIPGRKYATLASLPHLWDLHLGKAGLHDGDLKYLAALASLHELALLDNKHITDRGIAQIACLNKIYRLDVRGTQVTGSGILTLEGWPLKHLRVSNGAINTSQERAIKAAFPHVTITADRRPVSVPKEIFAPLH